MRQQAESRGKYPCGALLVMLSIVGETMFNIDVNNDVNDDVQHSSAKLQRITYIIFTSLQSLSRPLKGQADNKKVWQERFLVWHQGSIVLALSGRPKKGGNVAGTVISHLVESHGMMSNRVLCGAVWCCRVVYRPVEYS